VIPWWAAVLLVVVSVWFTSWLVHRMMQVGEYGQRLYTLEAQMAARQRSERDSGN